MTTFEAIFAMKEQEIKPNCLLMPLIPRFLLNELGIKNFRKSKLYSTANTDHFTLINTKVGAGFVGDAVLYLKDTPCQNLILFGTCGLINSTPNLNIASLVTPKKSYPLESFTDLVLEKPFPEQAFYPNNLLYQNIQQFNHDNLITITEVNCATMASLKLEEQWQAKLVAKQIDILDMECSAFFSAANSVNLTATALFCVSDIIAKQPFYQILNEIQKQKFISSYQKAALFLSQFMKQLNESPY